MVLVLHLLLCIFSLIQFFVLHTFPGQLTCSWVPEAKNNNTKPNKLYCPLVSETWLLFYRATWVFGSPLIQPCSPTISSTIYTVRPVSLLGS